MIMALIKPDQASVLQETQMQANPQMSQVHLSRFSFVLPPQAILLIIKRMFKSVSNYY